MTIQRRLWIANIILIFITILLLMGVSIIITENLFNFIGFTPQTGHIDPLSRNLFRVERTVNTAKEKNPDQFLDNTYLDQINDFLVTSNIGLIVEKEEQIIFLSPFLEEIGFDKNKFSPQQLIQEEEKRNIVKLSENLFMVMIPIQFGDNTDGNLLLINDSSSLSQELNRFKNSIIYTLILFLIIIISINTLITYFLSKQIVNPLIKLKNAALQIKNGNYNFSLQAPSKDEIGALFTSFESARERLKKSEDIKNKYEQSRNELITNISHDLKTPITTIKGYVEGILDGVPKTKEKENKYLQTIRQNVAHMENLIEDLFLLSKFDLEQPFYNFENINIKDYLTDSFEELKFYLQEKGIQLEFTVDYDEKELVKADRQQLKRVILNIINNAVNFKNDTNSIIKMFLNKNEDNAVVVINDNGKGVSEEILNKIFNRFYKADESRSDRSSGTGLGLYIAKKIILDHGGNIWAKSQPGIGTSIFFTLKIANNKKGQ